MTYLQPAILVFLAIIAAGLAWRKWRFLAWVGLALTLLWCSPLFAYLSAGSLEWFYPALVPQAAGEAEAIVVLGGAVMPSDLPVLEPYPSWDTYRRCKYAGWLYRHRRFVPVVVSGGPGPENVIIARAMRSELELEGVPSAAIITEERSTSTYENGLFSAVLLRARGIRKILLVTEAYHMLRAEKVFRKLGLEVVPAPCAFSTARFHISLDKFLPVGQPLTINNSVLHEWIGLGWYKLRGRV
jgi:uncharacterized SAM-binding protein YcdF (DUF218 family)